MAPPKAGKNSGTMALIVVALLLTLVGAGTGFAVGTLLVAEPAEPAAKATAGEVSKPAETKAHAAPEGHAPAESAAEPEAAAEEAEEIAPADLKTVPFPPVLTTLAEPKGKWIRLEGAIQVVHDTEDPPELLSERSGEQILTYLRSLRLDQLEGPSGVLGLREDLNEMVQTLSKGQVRGVLVHGLVVE